MSKSYKQNSADAGGCSWKNRVKYGMEILDIELLTRDNSRFNSPSNNSIDAETSTPAHTPSASN